MKTEKIISVFAVLVLFVACNNAKNKIEVNSNIATDQIAAKTISSYAAVENGKDTTRKFIRTAELKFKVKNVIKSTYDIEDIINKLGGFVTYTNLTSNINNVFTTAISADSSVETTSYLVTNTITVRVPNTKLDTTLKEISRNIEYLDYRIIKADDVALLMLTNNLTEKRVTKTEERLMQAIDNKGKRLNETTIAEEELANKQEQADNARVLNLSLKDQISFSTISISIYERESIKHEVICNNKNIAAYEPNFGNKFFESVKFGWQILESFIVFLTKCWAIFLLIVVAYIFYKKYRFIFKNKSKI